MLTSKWSIPDGASEAVHVSWTELVPRNSPGVGEVTVAVGNVASTLIATEALAEDPARSNACTTIVCGPSETPVRVVLVAVPGRTAGGFPSRLTSMWSKPLPTSAAVHVTWTLRVETQPATGASIVTVGAAVSTTKVRAAVVEGTARS